MRNSIEVEKGEKPMLVQRGPYVFSELWCRKNVEFLNMTILNYSPTITLKFEPDLSKGDLTDKITILNKLKLLLLIKWFRSKLLILNKIIYYC